jgi:hypothetical protein
VCALEGELVVVCAVEGDWECFVCSKRKVGNCVCSRR